MVTSYIIIVKYQNQEVDIATMCVYCFMLFYLMYKFVCTTAIQIHNCSITTKTFPPTIPLFPFLPTSLTLEFLNAFFSNIDNEILSCSFILKNRAEMETRMDFSVRVTIQFLPWGAGENSPRVSIYLQAFPLEPFSPEKQLSFSCLERVWMGGGGKWRVSYCPSMQLFTSSYCFPCLPPPSRYLSSLLSDTKSCIFVVQFYQKMKLTCLCVSLHTHTFRQFSCRHP